MAQPKGLRRDLTALFVIAFSFPIVLAIVFFPAPAIDLREQINWGLEFPLTTWKHPPLQSWVAGVVALTSLRDAWPYVLAAQLFNAGALVYVVRIAAEFLDEDAAIPAAVACCGLVSMSAGVVTSALNADQIQPLFWLGVLFHVLRASQHDRTLDWIACGIFAAFALLAKYFAAVFLSSLAIALIVNDPTLLRRRGPYLALLVCLAVTAVHWVPLMSDMQAVLYAAYSVEPGAGLLHRAYAAIGFIRGLVFYPLPFLLAGGWAWYKGYVSFGPMPRRGAAWVIPAATGILLLILLALILAGGARYAGRYTTTILPLGVLAVFSLVRLQPGGLPLFTRATLTTWWFVAIGAAIYALVFVNTILREPADAAAAIIRADWQRHYSCGPAYILGDKRTAHAVGLYYGGAVRGIAPEDYLIGNFVDPERLKRLGAIVVVSKGARLPELPLVQTGNRPPAVLRLPFRHTFSSREKVYEYRFSPPQGCERF